MSRRTDEIEQRALRQVIAQYHVAGCVHLLKGTTPDLPLDDDEEAFQELQRVAASCGC